MSQYLDIYGPPVAMVRGKTTRKKDNVNDHVDVGIKEERKIQTMASDIMNVNEESFLISVASPLEITIASHVVNQTKSK